jgi:prevent-host-death family protein
MFGNDAMRMFGRTLAVVSAAKGFDMRVKFSEDIVPLTDMKVTPGKIVKRTNETHRPVLLTSRGRGVAVMQSLDDYEKAEEEKAFMRAVVEGLNDLDIKR